MTRLTLILCFVASVVVGQTPLPERTPVTNALPWQIVGIQTNITSYPNGVSVDSFGADPTGVADSSTAINAAIASCPPFANVCFKIGGRYRINSQILVQNRAAVALAVTNVYFDAHITTGINAFYFVAGGIGVTNAVTSGYVRGSTNLILATTTGIVPGAIVWLNESNNPAIVKGAAYGQPQGPESEFDHNQIFQVVSVSGNNVALDHPIYITYTAAYGPGLTAMTAPCTNSGMYGSCTIDMANSTVDALWVYRAANCYIEGVIVTNTPSTHTGISLQFAYLTTVTQCIGPDERVQTSSAYGCQAVDCDRCLVFDNIFKNTGSPILVQIGSCGCVFSYNFLPGFFFTSINSMAPGAALHGDIPNMNLFEGNVETEQGLGDITWANNPTNTAFRCWAFANCFRTNYPTDDRSGFFMQGTNYGESMIGCLVGLPQDAGTIPGGSHIDYDFSTDAGAPSLYMYGDFSFWTGAITGTNGTTAGMPPSLYLPGNQSWMGSFTLPMIGPDVTTANSITNGAVIPAMARYLGIPYLPSRIARVTRFTAATVKIGP